MRYITKANRLLKAGFFMAGCGNFDITAKELSLILEYIENNDFKSIVKLYKTLQEERL